jgi:hypothetical protein
MKTVGSIAWHFRRRTPDAESLVDHRIGYFLFLKSVGVVHGSQYVDNSGQKLASFLAGH